MQASSKYIGNNSPPPSRTKTKEQAICSIRMRQGSAVLARPAHQRVPLPTSTVTPQSRSACVRPSAGAKDRLCLLAQRISAFHCPPPPSRQFVKLQEKSIFDVSLTVLLMLVCCIFFSICVSIRDQSSECYLFACFEFFNLI